MESRTFDAELEYVAPKGVEENGDFRKRAEKSA